MTAVVAELRIHRDGAAAIGAHAPPRRMGCNLYGGGHHGVSASGRYAVAQLEICNEQEDASDEKGEEEAENPPDEDGVSCLLIPPLFNLLERAPRPYRQGDDDPQEDTRNDEPEGPETKEIGSGPNENVPKPKENDVPKIKALTKEKTPNDR